jgi:hypothetical protein
MLLYTLIIQLLNSSEIVQGIMQTKKTEFLTLSFKSS